MKYPVYNQKGDKVKDVDLNAAIFEVPIKEELVHQAVVAQQANARPSLAHTKQRSEVRGGGRKPWRQKGTGRARAGSSRSPIWIGGGVTFGPTKKRNFSKNINKKMKKKALLMSLSDKVADKHLVLLDSLAIDEAKTKKFIEMVNGLLGKVATKDDKKKIPKTKLSYKTLVVTSETDDNLIRSSQNLAKVKVIRADSLNIVDILDYDWVLVPQRALEVIEKTYLK